MACTTCIRRVEAGALALFELVAFDRDELPPDTDWRGVAFLLRDLVLYLNAGQLPTGSTTNEGNSQEADGRTSEAPL